MKTTNDALDRLFEATADVLSSRIEEAQDDHDFDAKGYLDLAIKFMKANGYTFDANNALPGTPVHRLTTSLPFGDGSEMTARVS